ncbi:MAG: EamA family transporter [Chthoniobacter sp.]|nr:EamA family transporter [Chthoniobacter sp.]
MRRPLPASAFQLIASIVLFAASQLLLKRGAGDATDDVFNLTALGSPWVWAGITAEIASLVSWLAALRTVPLGVAYNLSGATHVLIPLGCWAWLGESISPLRWFGIALVVAGVVLSAQSAAAVEEKL